MGSSKHTVAKCKKRNQVLQPNPKLALSADCCQRSTAKKENDHWGPACGG